MDKVSIIFRAIELIPRFLPKGKPPVIDYTSLSDSIPKFVMPQVGATEVRMETREPDYEKMEEYPWEEPGYKRPPAPVIEAPAQEGVDTACLSCSRSHLSTVSGALSESIRFARESGVSHPEVQRRIMLAEDEINVMERIDLAPDALARATPEERGVAVEYLPKIRKLRQDLGNIVSTENLESVANEASLLGQEFRLRHMQLRGVDLNPVLQLAKRVQAGEMTMDEAKEELRHILPEEE